jgi:hypothetical protein
VTTPWNAEFAVGTVYKRGSRYWISYRDKKNGKRIRESAGASRLEAQRKLHKIDGTTFGIPFETIADAYRESLSVRAKKRSAEVADCSLRRWVRFLDSKDVKRLGVVELDSFVRFRQKEGVTARTINGDFIVLLFPVSGSWTFGWPNLSIIRV